MEADGCPGLELRKEAGCSGSLGAWTCPAAAGRAAGSPVTKGRPAGHAGPSSAGQSWVFPAKETLGLAL